MPRIVKPQAILEGLTLTRDHSSTEKGLKAFTLHPDVLLERAGRNCYKSEEAITDTSAQPFVEKICKVHKHKSVIEHGSATFRFITDRGITHEIVRHRLAAYSQESTRYCNYSKDKFANEIQVIVPPGLNPELMTSWWQAMMDAESRYLFLSSEGVKPQIARSVLPTCLKTEILMTCNFREWQHVFSMRCAPNAHPQIQEIMVMARDQLAELIPSLFSPEALSD